MAFNPFYTPCFAVAAGMALLAGASSVHAQCACPQGNKVKVAVRSSDWAGAEVTIGAAVSTTAGAKGPVACFYLKEDVEYRIDSTTEEVPDDENAGGQIEVEFPHCSVEYLDGGWRRGSSDQVYPVWDCSVFSGFDCIDLRITADATNPDSIKPGLVSTATHEPTTVWDPVAEQMVRTQPSASVAIRMGRVQADGKFRSAGLWVVSSELGPGLAGLPALRYHAISDVTESHGGNPAAVTINGASQASDGTYEFAGGGSVTTDDGVTGTLSTLPGGGYQIAIVHAGMPVGTYRFETVAGNEVHGTGTKFTHIEGNDVANAQVSIFAPTLTGDGAFSQVGDVSSQSATTPVNNSVYTTQKIVSENNDGARTILSSTLETFYQFPWADELITSVSDPTPDPVDGSHNANDELRVRYYQYYTDSAATASYGRLQAVFEDPQNGTGDWTLYRYETDLTRTFRPWLSTPLTMTSPGLAAVPTGAADMPDGYRLTEREETVVKGTAPNNWPQEDTTTTTREFVKLGGVVYALGESTEVESRQYDNDPDKQRYFTATRRETVADPLAHPDPPEQTSRRDENTWHERFFDQVTESTSPTGATSTYLYEFVDIADDGDPANQPPDASIPDPDYPEEGTNFRETRTEGIVAGSYLAGQTTQTITLENNDRPWLVETRVWDGAAFSLATVTEYVYDAQGRMTAVYQDTRKISETQYPTTRVTRRIDQAGVVTETEVDDQGRTVRMTREGGVYNGTSLPTITTTYEHDGLVTRTRRNGRLVELRERDALGRTVREIDEIGREISYHYTNLGRTVIETRPGGLQVVTTSHTDGQTASITGHAVVAQNYSYGVLDRGDADGDGTKEGFLTTTVVEGPARSRTTTTRWDGSVHSVAVADPSAPGGTVTSTSHYDSVGRVVRIANTAGQAEELMVYPGAAGVLGNHSRSGLDGDANQVIDPASMDRVTESEQFYEQDAAGWWNVSLAKSYHLDNNGSAYRFSRRKSLMNRGAGDRSIAEAGVFDGAETIHQRSEATRSYDPAAGTATTTSNETVRAGVEAVATSVSAFGFQVEEQSPYGGVPGTFVYDDHGRLIESTDARGAVRRQTIAVNGQLLAEVDPLGNHTRYQYYPANHPHAGRVKTVTNPAGETTEYSYTDRGEVASIAGSGEYPRAYTYTPNGELETLTTYGAAGPAVTRWIHDPATGLPAHKIHNWQAGDPDTVADGPAAGKTTSYTYDAAGRLKERLWARTLPSSSTRLITTYGYNSFGDLNSTIYNDGSTPAVIFANHDRNGQARLVNQAGIGDATMSYDDATAQLDVLAYDGGHALLPNLTVDHHAPELGRPTGYAVTDATGTLQDLSYGYDDQGRLQHIDTATHRSSYAYHPGTAIPQHTSTAAPGAAAPFVRQTRTLDLAGRTTGVVPRTSDGTAQPQIATAIGYAMDDAGRRIRATRNDGTAWHFSYNTRGEVTGGSKRLHDGTVLAGQQYEYDYDAIGNREKARYGGDSNGGNLREISYFSNELNQYTFIFHPDQVFVLGEAPAASTLTTTPAGATLNRQDDRFAAEFSIASRPGWHLLEVQENGGAADGGHAWFPPLPAIPTHDADGNLTNDGRWGYTWNGENRLVEMETLPSAVNAGAPYRKLLFTYDWQGRRIAKKVYDLDPIANPGATPITDRRFLYDAWNLTAEFEQLETSNLQLETSYTWGLDLSNTLQGAGGVGGLLSATTHGGATSTVYPHFDGNGNIVAWSGDSGAIQQRLDYDPFGKVIAREGELAGGAEVPFAFSTKFEDGETGLNYYGYRYYEPDRGRWPSRDRMGENGGENLHAFVLNSPLNGMDHLGLQQLHPGSVWGAPTDYPKEPAFRIIMPEDRPRPKIDFDTLPIPVVPNPYVDDLLHPGECCVDGEWVEKIPRYEAEGVSLHQCVKENMYSGPVLALLESASALGLGIWAPPAIATEATIYMFEVTMLDVAQAYSHCTRMVCPPAAGESWQPAPQN